MSREERLKAALRDNLKRRKLQARGRGPGSADGIEPEDEASQEPPVPAKQEPDRR